MATTVYDSETIRLQDGKEVTLMPLAIGRLRRFMKAWARFAELENEDQAFDIYIDCCGIALEKDFEADFETVRDEDNVLPADYREKLEDVLDMDTIYKILEVCGGLKLNDPKLLEEVEKAQIQAVKDAGKN